MNQEERCPECPAVTASKGLLWRNGEVIPLPEADRVARAHGYQYAEQLVRALEAKVVPTPNKDI